MVLFVSEYRLAGAGVSVARPMHAGVSAAYRRPVRPVPTDTWAVPRPARPPLLDVAVAAVFVVLTLVEAASSPDVDRPLLHAVLGSLALATLAWRRSAPLLVAAVVVAANVLLNPAGELSTLLSIVLVSASIGFHATGRRRALGIAGVLGTFLVVSVLDGFEPSDLAAGLVFFVGPWTVGVVLSGRLASADAAVARAAQLEQERELQAVRAAAAERTRIAREMHDIVSHSISVVTIQTQAVRRRLGPDHAREADDLRAVEQTAREALAEMRRILGVLRSSDADGVAPDLAPQPGLGELPRLVEQVGSGTMRTRLRTTGEPRALTPGQDLAAYRIAQEGLTNALRHARAAHAEVVVSYAEDALVVEVLDDGRGVQDDPGAVGGHGLVGMRERVALYDGSVELARRPGGGTRLHARLPYAGSATTVGSAGERP